MRRQIRKRREEIERAQGWWLIYTLDSKQSKRINRPADAWFVQLNGSDPTFPFLPLLETVKPCREHISDGHVEPGTRVYIVRRCILRSIYISRIRREIVTRAVRSRRRESIFHGRQRRLREDEDEKTCRIWKGERESMCMCVRARVSERVSEWKGGVRAVITRSQVWIRWCKYNMWYADV